MRNYENRLIEILSEYPPTPGKDKNATFECINNFTKQCFNE